MQIRKCSTAEKTREIKEKTEMGRNKGKKGKKNSMDWKEREGKHGYCVGD